jgi:hypothetical protein
VCLDGEKKAARARQALKIMVGGYVRFTDDFTLLFTGTPTKVGNVL